MAEHIPVAVVEKDTVNNLSDQVEVYTSGITSIIEGWGGKFVQWGQEILDRFITPEQRATLLAKIQEFMLANPKLSTFLGMNLALSGIPLGLFTIFGLTVAAFSLIVGVGVGIMAAILFTLFFVGAALAFVFPVVFFTTLVACFLFLWGLGGYYLLKWIDGDKAAEESEAKPLLASGSIGDSLNAMTGGRLAGFMDAAKAGRAKGDITGFSDEHLKPHPPPEKKEGQKTPANQPPKLRQSGTDEKQQPKQQSNVGTAVSAPTANVQRATKAAGIESKVKTATNATGVVKAGLTGATSLG